MASLTEKANSANQMPGFPNQPLQATPAVRQTNQTGPQTLNYPAQWSQWGTLRKASFDKEGKTSYVLENQKGQTLLYVNSALGTSLKDYVGRTVCLYGPLTYRSDDYLRTHVMTASHVAVRVPGAKYVSGSKSWLKIRGRGPGLQRPL